MKDYDISLSANDIPVKVTGFPKDFLTNILIGAASSLKGVKEVDRLDLTLRFGKVKMAVNNQPIVLGPFPTLIMARTLIAITSTLKGIEGEIVGLEVSLQLKN